MTKQLRSPNPNTRRILNWNEWLKFFLLYNTIGIIVIEIVQQLTVGTVSLNLLYLLPLIVGAYLAGKRGWSCAVC